MIVFNKDYILLFFFLIFDSLNEKKNWGNLGDVHIIRREGQSNRKDGKFKMKLKVFIDVDKEFINFGKRSALLRFMWNSSFLF